LTLRTLVAAGLYLAFGAGGAWAGPGSSYELYRAGRISEARVLARSELAAAEASGKDTILWAQLMHVAWIDEAIGEHHEALKHTNRALPSPSPTGCKTPHGSVVA
jgi:hypothetical protein